VEKTSLKDGPTPVKGGDIWETQKVPGDGPRGEDVGPQKKGHSTGKRGAKKRTSFAIMNWAEK